MKKAWTFRAQLMQIREWTHACNIVIGILRIMLSPDRLDRAW